MFTLSFYCDKLKKKNKTKTQQTLTHTTWNTQNVSHLLAGIFAQFSWHEYAFEVF